jgi:hypothetical protein
MKVRELLSEEPLEALQAMLRRLLVPEGTLADVMRGRGEERRAGGDEPSRDARTAAGLLAGAPDDAAFVMRPGPATARALRSVSQTRPHDSADSDEFGRLRLIRMPGSAKLLVVGDGQDAFVVTTEHQRDRLVE